MSCLRQYPCNEDVIAYNHDHLTSSLKMSKSPLAGWHFEMESHWWHDQLVSSLLKPSTGEARNACEWWQDLKFFRILKTGQSHA